MALVGARLVEALVTNALVCSIISVIREIEHLEILTTLELIFSKDLKANTCCNHSSLFSVMIFASGTFYEVLGNPM